MGWWSDARDNVIGGAKGVAGAALLGPMGWSAGMASNWMDRQKKPPTRGPGDYNTPGELALGQEMVPGRDNPMVRRWTEGTRLGLARAGANPAAQAAGARMAQTQGFAQMARLSPEYWQRLMSQALRVSQARDSINTTTSQNAFLQGFGQGGGFQGLGGMFAGGGGSATAMDRGSAYSYGAAWDPDARIA